jgi:hypothetical protein
VRSQRSNLKLLVFTYAGMELSWRFAALSLSSLLLLPRSFPWPHTIAAFAGASLLTALLKGRGLRVITLLMLHLVCFLPLYCLLLHYFHGGSADFWNWVWVAALAHSPRPLATWLAVIFELALLAWLWIGGFNLARRPKTYQRVGLRFDLGLTVLFALVLFSLMLADERFGVVIDFRAIQPTMVSFFCFGLLSLSLARIGDPVPRDTRPGYRVLGLVLTFLVIVLALAGGAVAFFMPQLTAAAETGFAAVKVVVRPLAPYLIAILKFILVGRREHPAGDGSGLAPPAQEAGGALPEQASWLDAVIQVAGWVILVLVAAAILILTGYLAYRLFLRLMASTEASAPRIRFLEQTLDWLSRWIAGAVRWVVLVFRRRSGPLEVYTGLQKWGRRSGLPRRLGETPHEYGQRLCVALPRAAIEIEAVIQHLELSVFAAKPLAPRDLKGLRRSWRRLVSPSLWPHRFRLWLPGPRR